MTENKQAETLEALLDEYASAESVARDIDRAMLSMVLLLRYEKEQLETLVECYETLYELRNVILNYKS